MNDNKITCSNCESFKRETKKCLLTNKIVMNPNKIVCQAHQAWPYVHGKRRPK